MATEGSNFSKSAIEKCCKMFEESDNTEFRIISAVVPTYTSAEPFPVPANYVQEVCAAARKAADDAVSNAEMEIRKHVPDIVRLSSHVVVGSPSQVIVEEAEKWGADLIIVGSHGYGFWQRALLGSVSNAVVHHAPCSVLVVRPPQKLNVKNI